MRRVFLGVVVFLLVVIAVQRLARRDPVTAQAGPTFRCGDVDGDGTINITDPILLLNWLFLEGPEPACADPAPQSAMSGTAEFAEVGEHSWTCPEGVHAVMVELWGGCGGGGGAALHDSQAQMIPAGGGGGGAGAYVRTVVAVTPGQTYKLAVGRGGDGGLAGAVGFPEGRPGQDGTPTAFEDVGGSARALAGGGSGGGGGGLVSNVPGSVAPGGDGGPGGEPQAADGIRRVGALGADAEDVTEMATMSPAPPAHGGIGVGGSISAPHAVAWTRTPRSSMCDPAMASMCREDWSFLGRLAGGRGGSTWGYRWDPDAMISVRFSEPGDKGSDGYAVLQW